MLNILGDYSSAIEIDATNVSSPWNTTVAAAFMNSLPADASVPGAVSLGEITAGARRAHIRTISVNVTSSPIGSGPDLFLNMRAEMTIGIEITETGTDPFVITLPRPISYSRLYRPAIRSGTRGRSGSRELGLEWRSEPASSEQGTSAWDDSSGRLARLGFALAQLHDTALNTARRFFTDPFFRLTSIAVNSSTPTDLPVMGTATLSSINTFWIDAKLFLDREFPVVVAFLIENTTTLRSGMLGPTAPNPATYATRQLRRSEGIAVVVQPNLLLEAMAAAVNLLLNLGTSSIPVPPGTPPPPASLMFLTAAPLRSRFAAPFTLRPGLPAAITDLTITAPGVAPRTARVQRLNGTIVGGRLRLTIALSDPGDWAGIVWGFQGFIDWNPSVSSGAFVWTITPPVVQSSYVHVSAFWWIVEGVLIVATIVTGGIAGSVAAGAGVAIALTTIAAVALVSSVVLGGILEAIQIVVSNIMTTALGGVGGVTRGVPPIGTTLVPPELTALFGPLSARRALLDDLVVAGELPPPDAEVHMRARDLSAAIGEAFDLDAGTVETHISMGRIPAGADLIWWNAGGSFVVETAPAAGAVRSTSDSFSAIRFDQLQGLTFAPLSVPAMSIPVFDSPPPLNTSGLPVRPLLLGVRTTEGRIAKCALWRDRSDRLHIDFVTYVSPIPRLGIPYSRSSRRGAEIERGWSDLVRADYVRYQASFRFAFRAVWERLQDPVVIRWFINGTEIAHTGFLTISPEPIVRLEEPPPARLSYEAAATTLVVETRMGEAVAFEVSAIARDALGLEVRRAAFISVDGTVTEYGDSDWLWVQHQLRAITLLDESAYRLPLDMGDPALIPSPAEYVFATALQAGMGFSITEALTSVGLKPGIDQF